MPKRKGTSRTSAATSASLALRAAAAAAPVDDDNDEVRATNDEHDEPVWRQLDDFLTTAAPFNCGGFGQVRASTAPSACSLNAAPLLTGLARCARERAQLQVRQGAFMGLSENLPHICTTCTDMRMHMLMIMILSHNTQTLTRPPHERRVAPIGGLVHVKPRKPAQP